MKSFKELINNRIIEEEVITDLVMLFEHKTYKNIKGTKTSYREDSANLNSKTLKHSHIYAKPNGRGKELYSVNINGTGHDGSSGTLIPKKQADFFREKGYSIAANNILENIDLNNLNESEYELIFMNG